MLFVSTDRMLAVSIQPKAVRRMLSETTRARSRETGGILVGRYSFWRDRAIVEEATPPPRDSIQQHASFLRGVAGLGRLLERRWPKGLYYVGDWHFHPYASATPSPRDLAQMRAFAIDRDYSCERPILVVVGGDPSGDWAMEVRVISAGKAERLTRATTVAIAPQIA